MLRRLRKKHHHTTHHLHRKHKKHFSKKWGIVILGVLLLGLIIAIPQLSQNQDPRSKAAFYESIEPKNLTKCNAYYKNTISTGYCVNRNKSKNGSYNYCINNLHGNYFTKGDCKVSGDECCVVNIATPQACKNAGIGDQKGVCEKILSGTSRRYLNGLCPGPANIKCRIQILTQRSLPLRQNTDKITLLQNTYKMEVQKAGGNWSSKVILTDKDGNLIRDIVNDNSGREMNSASVNKLAIAVAVLDIIERGFDSLDRELTVSERAFGAENDEAKGKYTIGSKKTVKEVLRDMIVLSSNTAVRVLQDQGVISGYEVNTLLEQKGIANTELTQGWLGRAELGYTTSNDMVNLLARLWRHDNTRLLSYDSSELILGWMKSSTYKDGVRSHMSRERSYVKYGNLKNVRNEVGIFQLKDGRMVIYAFFTDGLSGAPGNNDHPVVKAHRELGKIIAQMDQ